MLRQFGGAGGLIRSKLAASERRVPDADRDDAFSFPFRLVQKLVREDDEVSARDDEELCLFEE
jgi:hypothetical protein